MSKLHRELSIDEKRLWRRVAEGVRTRRPLPEVTLAPAPSRAAAPPSRTRATAPLVNARPAALAPLTDRAGEKRVRRGRVDVGAALDLHGHTQAAAREALARFLISAHSRGARVVVVITGVGRAGGGVLKRLLPEWLAEREVRGLVSGYAQAHRSHGGAGAYYVFLKRARPNH